MSWMPGGWRHRPEVNTVPRQGHSSAREREGGCLHLLSLGATAEPKTKRKWPAVPRATRTKRKIPAAGRSRYALPSRRIQHREERIIRETEDRREQREARGGSAPCTSPCWSQPRPCCRRTSRSRMLTSWVQPTKFRVACARAVWANALHTSNSGSVRHWNAG